GKARGSALTPRSLRAEACEAALEVGALGGAAREAGGGRVGAGGLLGAGQAAQEVGAGGGGGVGAGEPRGGRGEGGGGRPGVAGERDRDGAVELHDRVGIERREVAVERRDAGPDAAVGVLDGNRRVQRVAPGRAHPQRAGGEQGGLLDAGVVPAGAVLVLEQD